EAQSQETFVKDGAEWTRKVFKLELAAQKAGEGKIEGFTIAYVNSDSPAGPQQFRVEPHTIQIKGPAFQLPSYLKGLFLIPAVIAMFFVFRRKPAVEKIKAPVIPEYAETPVEQALERLQKIHSA